MFRILALTIALSFALIGRANAQTCGSLFSSLEEKLAEQNITFVKHGDLFELKGSSRGSEISKLIASVQSEAKVILDPAYRENNASAAHYKDREIVVGPDALHEGPRFYLRHEIQHLKEDLKIENGEPSLARFAYGNDAKSLKDGYEGYLRFDELEAHLVELENTKDRATKKALHALLVDMVAREKKLIDRLFDRIGSMSMIEAMALVKWPYTTDVPMTHAIDVSLGENETMRLQISLKMYQTQAPKRSQMRQLILDTIDQFDTRIVEIETDLHKLDPTKKI